MTNILLITSTITYTIKTILIAPRIYDTIPVYHTTHTKRYDTIQILSMYMYAISDVTLFSIYFAHL